MTVGKPNNPISAILLRYIIQIKKMNIKVIIFIVPALFVMSFSLKAQYEEEKDFRIVDFKKGIAHVVLGKIPKTAQKEEGEIFVGTIKEIRIMENENDTLSVWKTIFISPKIEYYLEKDQGEDQGFLRVLVGFY